jgi:hypothetical protein
MKLSELKDWLSKIPDEFSDYEIYTGGEKKEEDNYFYKVYIPVTTCLVDKETQLVLFLSEDREETES